MGRERSALKVPPISWTRSCAYSGLCLKTQRRRCGAVKTRKVQVSADDRSNFRQEGDFLILDLNGYRDYLPKKFDTIRNSNSRPRVDIAVLYEGLTPEEFPYALRLIQGDVTCLLTMRFKGVKVSSLYMTDPDIYTYEPTFAKGGIRDENDEPRVFRHECEEPDRGRPMSEKELQGFAVKCIEQLYREAGAEIEGVYKSEYKEFPNLIVKCGCDLYYHRIDVSDRANDGAVVGEDREEFIAAAKMHDAWPMVLPVSFWCADTNGGEAVCGGSFFMKVRESVIVEA